MNHNDRKVILYISMSLDGFIANESGGLDFLNRVIKEGEDYGYQKFVDSIDTVVIGRKTYEKVIEMGYSYPHTDKNVYIITKTARQPLDSFQFYTGSLELLIKDLKTKPGKNIYCDGGAQLANELMRLSLIDEYIISVIPHILGNGIPLFQPNRPEQSLELISVQHFDTGLVQLHYKKTNT